ncbi:MBL fold metallo-hydrolase [Paenibacillus wynnii]|uniref:MBL fold metallo-hydrolase n=1 Tax=Paenibacillus wynnii TaxID=268407 RepID=UPI00278DEAC7|nr:MBL fold metallo-hydrolase [Paenibacillus wynnii]MDQ0194643.1 glyoxylase-like metal-dependent hydrolase (beta-lactamase superfamily II) [Paenibacillus wynnii]
MVTGRRFKEDEGSIRGAVITPREGNILQISVPMDPPLRQVNSYLLTDTNGGVTIIDPGPHSQMTELAWQGILRELNLSWSRVQKVVITHHHPDHYGLAGWMQSLSGCKVWMSKRAHTEALFMWGETSQMNEVLPLFFAKHGMPNSITDAIKEHLEHFEPQVTPQPEVSYVSPAEPFEMGNQLWRPVVTGGHAPGHLSFYNRESGYMICGDAVLPQISPNVSLLPGSDPQPLQTFLLGLRELSSYQVSMAFPGHREPFTGFTERIHSLLDHHEERLEASEALITNGPLSGFAICEDLFRGRISSTHQMRFAMSETLAHMIELVRRERAMIIESSSGLLFTGME